MDISLLGVKGGGAKQPSLIIAVTVKINILSQILVKVRQTCTSNSTTPRKCT